MKTEFNLSDKIIKSTKDMKEINLDYSILEIEDVKEFIRLLKEELKKQYLTEEDFEIFIDKLAGEKLTK